MCSIWSGSNTFFSICPFITIITAKSGPSSMFCKMVNFIWFITWQFSRFALVHSHAQDFFYIKTSRSTITFCTLWYIVMFQTTKRHASCEPAISGLSHCQATVLMLGSQPSSLENLSNEAITERQDQQLDVTFHSSGTSNRKWFHFRSLNNVSTPGCTAFIFKRAHTEQAI